MNVIVSNKYRDMLNSLEFDISKNINGEFTVDEIINNFSSYFFNKMFLDITAIKDYQNLQNIQKLSINLDMSKVILILDDNQYCSSPQFLSQLISMGIYNFTRNKEGIIYLYNHPNIYRDVAHLHNLNNQAIISDNNFNNITKTNINISNQNNTIIIGIKNLTSHAGATTLVYMLKKVLSNYYGVKAIEVNRRDFMYFRDNDMLSVSSSELRDTISRNSESYILLIDINDGDSSVCTDILYLVEPTIIKLNKLIMIDKDVFKKYYDKKIILNKSMLNSKDIEEFEREAGINIFYSLPSINDRENYADVLIPLINKLGLIQKV